MPLVCLPNERKHMELISIVLAVAGLGLGYGGSTYINKKKSADAENKAEKELAKAKKEAQKLVDEARDEAKKLSEETRKDCLLYTSRCV